MSIKAVQQLDGIIKSIMEDTAQVKHELGPFSGEIYRENLHTLACLGIAEVFKKRLENHLLTLGKLCADLHDAKIGLEKN